MSTNGSDRSRQPGSAGSNNDNLSWRMRAPSPAHRVPETMIAGTRHHQDVGLYVAAPSDPSHRLYLTGSQYPYSATPSSGLYSQALYTIHGGQPSHLGSRYPPYYPQYLAAAQAAVAANYGHSSVIPYPHIESYSAVLASMGSHVQHATHSVSQIPSHVPYLPAPPTQLHRYSGYQSSGDKASYGHKTRAETWSSTGEFRSRVFSAPVKDSKHSIPHHGDKPSAASTSLSPESTEYKVPSGKEGSMKHRILTRPPDHSTSIASCDTEATTRRVYSDTTHRSAASTSTSSSLHYPPHFMRGSIIELANSQLKRVEELQTEDFVQSAVVSRDLKIDSSTVVKIDKDMTRGTVLLGFSVGQHRVQVTVEAALEHPFFVFGRGWSSCSPERTVHRYGLECETLTVGDVCISLTHKDVITHAEALEKQQQIETTTTTTTASTEVTTASEPKSGITSAAPKRAHIHFAMDKPAAKSDAQSDLKSDSKSDRTDTTKQPSDTETETKPATSAELDLTLTSTRKRRWSAPDEAAEDLVSPCSPVTTQQQTDTTTTTTSTTTAAHSGSSCKSMKEDSNNNT